MLAWIRLILRHRWLVLLGLAVISLASVASLSRAVIATSMEKMMLVENPAYASYKVRAEEFGGDELLIVAYDEPDPLSEDALNRLESAVTRLSALPEVSDVFSLMDAVEMVEEDGMLLVRTYAEAARDDPARIEALTRALRDEPGVGGLVLSNNGQHGAVVVAMRADPNRSAEEGPALVEKVSGILAEEGLSNLRRTGYLAMWVRKTSRVFPLRPPSDAVLVGVVG